jgi:glycosyltransferase involved in cell wall biosynthesis
VEPADPERFARDLAAGVNALLADPALRERMGRQARARVEERFSWASIARQTRAFYADVIARHAREHRAS